VDRGKSSTEILLILFAFLLVYPNGVHLNRGNHEDHMVNLRWAPSRRTSSSSSSSSIYPLPRWLGDPLASPNPPVSVFSLLVALKPKLSIIYLCVVSVLQVWLHQRSAWEI